MKFLNYEGLEHLVAGIKERFVQKVSGKDLSTNDFTNLYKDKIDGIENNAQINKIELIKRNGANLSIGVDKSVDINVPTKLSDLTNDKTFQTKAEILTLITDNGKLKKEVVTELPDPTTADENTIYLIASVNGYAEWIIINGEWEKLGDTADINLTGYVKFTDIEIISNAEIDVFLNAL